MTHCKVGMTVLTILLSSQIFAAGPATRPAASQPATGRQRSLANDLIHFIEPSNPPWSAPEYKPEADAVLYITTAKDGAIQLMLLPKDASVDANIAANVAVAIMKELREEREKAHTKVVMPATIEKDSRFAIRIHEKYKAGDSTADELHLYKAAGPRVLMLTVNSVAGDTDAVAATHKAGEQMLINAKFNRAAFKRDR